MSRGTKRSWQRHCQQITRTEGPWQRSEESWSGSVPVALQPCASERDAKIWDSNHGNWSNVEWLLLMSEWTNTIDMLRQLPFLRTFHPACYCTWWRAQTVKQSTAQWMLGWSEVCVINTCCFFTVVHKCNAWNCYDMAKMSFCESLKRNTSCESANNKSKWCVHINALWLYSTVLSYCQRKSSRWQVVTCT